MPWNIIFSLEADGCSSNQNVPWFLWNLQDHSHIYKRLPLVRIMTQLNVEHTLQPHSCLSGSCCLGRSEDPLLTPGRVVYVAKRIIACF